MFKDDDEVFALLIVWYYSSANFLEFLGLHLFYRSDASVDIIAVPPTMAASAGVASRKRNGLQSGTYSDIISVYSLSSED
ncbi:hypothetical protein HPB50_023191 [Hyalomma asiaticum]|uniref:Uncharacterized protein n=1 Tax=Hyalomma asiaticum TaxID=266040 RepID=A0ACB7TS45_HYAAI|nr:hypothetical protein HPB50_023191 [Hyalomma asiaticum]